MHRFIPAHRAAGDADLEQRALGTGIRLTVAVSSVLAARLGSAGAAGGARVARAEPGGDAADHGAGGLAGGNDAGAGRGDHGREGGAHEPLRARPRRTDAAAAGGGAGLPARRHIESLASRTSPARAWSRRSPWRHARACSAPRFCGARWRAPDHPGFAALRAPPRGVRSDERRAESSGHVHRRHLRGLDALAVYTAAEFITRVIANPRYLFDHIIAPVLAEALHMHDRARVRYNLALVTRWVITACAPDRGDGDRAARGDPWPLRRCFANGHGRAGHPRRSPSDRRAAWA